MRQVKIIGIISLLLVGLFGVFLLVTGNIIPKESAVQQTTSQQHSSFKKGVTTPSSSKIKEPSSVKQAAENKQTTPSTKENTAQENKVKDQKNSTKERENSTPSTEKIKKEAELTKPNPPISQETIDRLNREHNSLGENNGQGETDSKTSEAELTKPNPPISQETIDRLNREYNNSGAIHRLDVAHQVQRAWNTCAPTTVSMMLASRGKAISQEVLANEMGTDTIFGTHNANAIAVLNRHLFGYDSPAANQPGYRLAMVTTDDSQSEQMRLFKERLKQNIKDGYPMYYTFDNAKIYPGSRGEHNVIGTGYQLTADGSDIAYLYYIDPSYLQQDPQYGGLKKITPQELFTAMIGCVEPNYAW